MEKPYAALLSLMNELASRNSLRDAVIGRNEEELSLLLRFIKKNLFREGISSSMMVLLQMVLEVYFDPEIYPIQPDGNKKMLVAFVRDISQAVDDKIKEIDEAVNPIIGMLELVVFFNLANSTAMMGPFASASAAAAASSSSSSLTSEAEAE